MVSAILDTTINCFGYHRLGTAATVLEPPSLAHMSSCLSCCEEARTHTEETHRGGGGGSREKRFHEQCCQMSVWKQADWGSRKQKNKWVFCLWMNKGRFRPNFTRDTERADFESIWQHCLPLCVSVPFFKAFFLSFLLSCCARAPKRKRAASLFPSSSSSSCLRGCRRRGPGGASFSLKLSPPSSSPGWLFLSQTCCWELLTSTYVHVLT